MTKLILNVQGLMCPHCEARVNQGVENVPSVQGVISSHKKGTVEAVCADDVSVEAVKSAIRDAGYAVTGVSTKKKGLLGLWL